MPLAGLAEAHEDEERQRRKRFGQYLIVALFLVVATTGLQMWLVGDVRSQVDVLRDVQSDGIERGLKNRAVACTNAELLGAEFPPDDPCRDPALVDFFTPSGP